MSNQFLTCPDCHETFHERLAGNGPHPRCAACGIVFARALNTAPARDPLEFDPTEAEALRSAVTRSGRLMFYCVIAGLAVATVSIVMNVHQRRAMSNPAEQLIALIGGLLGLAVSVLPLLFLLRSSQRVTQYLHNKQISELGAALKSQSSYWKTYAVIAYIGIAVGLVGIVVVIRVALAFG